MATRSTGHRRALERPGPARARQPVPALKFMLDENLIEESERRPVAAKDDERRRYYRLTSSAARWRWRRPRDSKLASTRARLVARSASRV